MCALADFEPSAPSCCVLALCVVAPCILFAGGALPRLDCTSGGRPWTVDNFPSPQRISGQSRRKHALRISRAPAVASTHAEGRGVRVRQAWYLGARARARLLVPGSHFVVRVSTQSAQIQLLRSVGLAAALEHKVGEVAQHASVVGVLSGKGGKVVSAM